MKQIITIVILAFALPTFAQELSQEQIDSILNRQFPDQEIEDVVVIYRDSKSQAKLRRDVLKAYPYALRAASIIEQIEANTADIKKKRNKKRYLKKKEKILKEQFETNLRKLTRTQGRYMVRLIHRETGTPVYDLIKEYKGGLNATFWQIIAKKFDSDLKSHYDSGNVNSIDYEIEQIVKDISPRYVKKIKGEIIIKPPTYRDFQKD